MLALIDYGMGNIMSVHKAFKYLGCDPVVVKDGNSLSSIESLKGIILPGVGAFGGCMKSLTNRGLDKEVKRIIENGVNYLGICLGLQILFESSEESPGIDGLGVFSGTNKRFPDGIKVPHMGWNRIKKIKDNPLMKGIDDGKHFYFVHSYYVYNRDIGITSTVTEYNVTFTSSVWKDNVFSCQFHPEKSQDAGLKLLKNFIDICL